MGTHTNKYHKETYVGILLVVLGILLITVTPQVMWFWGFISVVIGTFFIIAGTNIRKTHFY